ncbi:MAG: putative primosomal protein N' [bacterium]|nr:MAG: putative primosomal protein N' [bacterium]
MHLCDIVFPQNLPPLTYSVPEKLRPSVKAGMMVLAPLRGKIKKGMVLRHYPPGSGTFKGRLNEIIEIVMPAYSPSMTELLDWSTDYYITNHGTMLKSMPFKEILKAARKPRHRPPAAFEFTPPLPSEEEADFINEISTSVRKGAYRTFLYHAPGDEHEIGFVLRLLQGIRSALILAPEVRDAELLYSLLRGLPDGNRVCAYHGEMKRPERYDSIEGIYAGRYNIVVGTRPVVFAPLFSPSVIIVTKEHNTAYKQEQSPRYHGRDVAVMRGFIEKIPVVLTSVSPSVESCYNSFNNKYILLRQRDMGTGPDVSLIQPGKAKTVAPFLSVRLLNSLRTVINKTGKTETPAGAMVVIQRRGYSMLKCDDCEEIEMCAECRTPLVVHRGEGLVCHLCGYSKEIPHACSRCGSFKLSHFGAGTERIEEELKKHLGINVIRQDSDISRKLKAKNQEPETGHPSEEVLLPDSTARHIVVGTLKARRIPQKSLDIIAFLNPDLLLNLPEVRAPEKLVQEIYSLRGLLSEKGRLLLQTEIPWHPVYKYLRKWDYTGFIKDELRVRKESSMPPYTKLVTLCIYTNDDKFTTDRLSNTIRKSCGRIEAIGPVRITPKIKGYSSCFQVILRDMNRQALKECAKSVKKVIEDAGMTLRIDVDPVLF